MSETDWDDQIKRISVGPSFNHMAHHYPDNTTSSIWNSKLSLAYRFEYCQLQQQIYRRVREGFLRNQEPSSNIQLQQHLMSPCFPCNDVWGRSIPMPVRWTLTLWALVSPLQRTLTSRVLYTFEYQHVIARCSAYTITVPRDSRTLECSATRFNIAFWWQGSVNVMKSNSWVLGSSCC